MDHVQPHISEATRKPVRSGYAGMRAGPSPVGSQARERRSKQKMAVCGAEHGTVTREKQRPDTPWALDGEVEIILALAPHGNRKINGAQGPEFAWKQVSNM